MKKLGKSTAVGFTDCPEMAIAMLLACPPGSLVAYRNPKDAARSGLGILYVRVSWSLACRVWGSYVEVGDLDADRETGLIRIVTPKSDPDPLPCGPEIVHLDAELKKEPVREALKELESTLEENSGGFDTPPMHVKADKPTSEHFRDYLKKHKIDLSSKDPDEPDSCDCCGAPMHCQRERYEPLLCSSCQEIIDRPEPGRN